MSELRLTTTKDGSHSLLNTDLNEHYHSQHGALQESIHVFLRSAFDHLQKPSVSILEYGFGTGLNALLTLQEAQKTHKKVHYTSLEARPLNTEIIDQLNYADQAGIDPRYFADLHQAKWNELVAITPYFSLEKRKQRFEDYMAEANTYDLIYFDAFAPRYHPEAWSREVLHQCYEALKPEGIWVSYCAQGAVRRTLMSVGFTVEKIPGPPGKREMLRGIKT
ncbi:MAG: tRNA (5-methylaminomethyl-2-thiouridine)(34)-methyltransferase MnmD [Cryomorphaceae bacterium]|nr:tRNA (5-methylaminomethyl-2-thiouridine)(34)-methyltransferase MnmD [Cryomorphaceae bacterium]